jgi:hypothetical protein
MMSCTATPLWSFFSSPIQNGLLSFVPSFLPLTACGVQAIFVMVMLSFFTIILPISSSPMRKAKHGTTL